MSELEEVLKLALDDADRTGETKSDILKALELNAIKLRNLEAEKEETEAKLKDLNERIQNLNSRIMPTLMSEVSMKTFTLDDGTEFNRSRIYRGKIDDENRDAWMGFLRKEGLDGIIKTDITIPFTKGEDEGARELQQKIQQLTNKPVLLESEVHWQTLSATIKDILENPDPMYEPLAEQINERLQEFKITTFDLVKVKPAKPKKGKR